MASTSSPPSGSQTESNSSTADVSPEDAPTEEALSTEAAEWHASRFRASWEPPEPAPPVQAAEIDEEHEPIELHRVTSSMPPASSRQGAGVDELSAGLPPAEPATTTPADGQQSPAAEASSVPEVSPSPGEGALPSVPTELTYGERGFDSADMPVEAARLRASTSPPLVLMLGVVAGVLILAVAALWAFLSGGEETAASAAASNTSAASAPATSSAGSVPALAPAASAPAPAATSTPESAAELEEPGPAAASPDVDEPSAIVPEEPAVASTVTVALQVFPRLARVEVDGELWRAPFRRTLPSTTDSRQLVVSRRGYETVERTLEGDRDLDMTIRLPRRPTKSRRNRAAAMSPRPTLERRPPGTPRRVNASRPRPRRRRGLGAGFTTSNPY